VALNESIQNRGFILGLVGELGNFCDNPEELNEGKDIPG
jgi:hypothetical protein